MLTSSARYYFSYIKYSMNIGEVSNMNYFFLDLKSYFILL